MQWARLGIALISVVNASAALADPKAVPVAACGAVLVASESADRAAPPLSVRRPPRVPRREPYRHGQWRRNEAIGGRQ